MSLFHQIKIRNSDIITFRDQNVTNIDFIAYRDANTYTIQGIGVLGNSWGVVLDAY